MGGPEPKDPPLLWIRPDTYPAVAQNKSLFFLTLHTVHSIIQTNLFLNFRKVILFVDLNSWKSVGTLNHTCTYKGTLNNTYIIINIYIHIHIYIYHGIKFLFFPIFLTYSYFSRKIPIFPIFPEILTKLLG